MSRRSHLAGFRAAVLTHLGMASPWASMSLSTMPAISSSESTLAAWRSSLAAEWSRSRPCSHRNRPLCGPAAGRDVLRPWHLRRAEVQRAIVPAKVSRPAVGFACLGATRGSQPIDTAAVFSPPYHRITSSRGTVERTFISGSSVVELRVAQERSNTPSLPNG
jgi:hypothetical protein